MSNRPMLAGISTVEVDQTRYDELLHKEERLALVTRVLRRTGDIYDESLLKTILTEEEHE